MTPDFGEIMRAMRSGLVFASARHTRRRSKAPRPRRPRPRPPEALHRARPQPKRRSPKTALGAASELRFAPTYGSNARRNVSFSGYLCGTGKLIKTPSSRQPPAPHRTAVPESPILPEPIGIHRPKSEPRRGMPLRRRRSSPFTPRSQLERRFRHALRAARLTSRKSPSKQTRNPKV